MVATRRRRVPTVVPESPESSARDNESVRDIDIEPVLRRPPVAPESSNSASPTLPPTRAPSRAPTVRSLRSSRRSTAAPSLVPSIVRSRARLSPATPPGSPPRTPPPLPAMPRAPRLRRSPSSPSVASFAGPGLRGARLLALAPSSARNSFLNAFDALNDEFAAQLRQRGVPLPGVAPSVQSPASTLVNTPRGPPRGSSPPGSPRAHPYRRPASPATPPRRPRDAPRPPPLRNLRPFLGPDLAPFARAELAPRRPASPAAVNPGNFVLPADLDDNGDLLATVTSFPAQALKIMHDRWRQHLPLTMFTPKALKDSSRRPFSNVTYAQSTADGRIAFVAPDIDDRAELGLTESEWRQAIPAYLRLVHYHCSRPNKDRIVRGLQAHFEWIMARPDFYSDFVLYLQYNITIRKFVASMENYIPKEYECNIFMDIEKKYTRDLARGRILSTDNMHQTRPRSRSPSPRRNARAGSSRLPFQSRSPPRSYGTRPRGFDSRGQSFRQPSTVIFCIVCGRTGHLASACSPSGRTYLLLDKETNRWLAPGGAQLCYRWNNNAQACKSCTRDHWCTLCGDKGHNARACPRANP